MKIGKKGSDLTTQDAATIQQQQLDEAQSAKNAKELAAKAKDDADAMSVQLGLSALINKEFDPTQLSNERSQRVEELKRLVQSGQYKPDSYKVAAAVGEEISFAILTEGNGE